MTSGVNRPYAAVIWLTVPRVLRTVEGDGEQEETLLSLSGNIPEMNVSLESRVALVGVSVLLLGFAGVCACAIYLKRKNNRKQ